MVYCERSILYYVNCFANCHAGAPTSASTDSWRVAHAVAQSRSTSLSEASVQDAAAAFVQDNAAAHIQNNNVAYVQDNPAASTAPSGAEVGAAADFAAEFAVRSGVPTQLQPSGLSSNQLWVPMPQLPVVDSDGFILVCSFLPCW